MFFLLNHVSAVAVLMESLIKRIVQLIPVYFFYFKWQILHMLLHWCRNIRRLWSSWTWNRPFMLRQPHTTATVGIESDNPFHCLWSITDTWGPIPALCCLLLERLWSQASECKVVQLFSQCVWFQVKEEKKWEEFFITPKPASQNIQRGCTHFCPCKVKMGWA